MSASAMVKRYLVIIDYQLVIAIATAIRITITVVVTVIVKSVRIITVIDINNKVVRYSSDDNGTDGAGNVDDNGICLFQFLLRIKYLQKRYYVMIQV